MRIQRCQTIFKVFKMKNNYYRTINIFICQCMKNNYYRTNNRIIFSTVNACPLICKKKRKEKRKNEKKKKYGFPN